MAGQRRSGPAGLGVCFLLLAPSIIAALAAAPAAALETTGSGQGVRLWLDGIEFPVELAFAPDGRAFVADRFSGDIRVIDTRGLTPRLLPAPFVNVGPINTSGEQGLIGVAVDPDFEATPWVYAYYTFDDGVTHENRVTRYWAATNISNMSEPVYWGISAGFFHNAGVLKFGSDGMLYVTTGDATDGGKVQDLNYTNGKVLRMEKDGTMPADNPFPGTYAYTIGHRNVFGIDQNPRNGVFYVTENMEDENDEINMLVPGDNYGWPLVNGTAGEPRFRDPLWNITPTVAPTGLAFDKESFGGGGSIFLYVADWNVATIRRFQLDPPNYDVLKDEQILLTRSTPSIDYITFGPGGLLYIVAPTGIYTSDLSLVGNQPPVPVIYASRSTQFVGRNISFGGGDSYDPEGGGIYSHDWDFGDGTTAQGTWIVKSFGASGTYHVTLSVTDEQKTANVTSVDVTVKDPSDNLPPVATIFQNRTVQFTGYNVSFGGSDSSDPEGGGIQAYAWELGDGSTATGSWVSHTYATPGVYSVNLTVRDELGATGSAAAQLTVKDPSQNQPPVAVISAAGRRQAVAGVQTSFSGADSTDAEGGIKSYRWDFGDGGTASNATPRHTFPAPGTYTVSLVVQDELGASGGTSIQVGVLDPALNQPPVAQITPPPGFAINGNSLVFSAENSTDPEGGDMHFSWDFGNGGTADGPLVEYVYDEPGTYRVVLTAADDLGAQGQAVLDLTVYRDGPPPVAAFVMNDWKVRLGEGIYFDGASSYDPSVGGFIEDAWWTFGDGGEARGLQVWHGYAEVGRYPVTLTVVNDRGSVASYTTYVEIEPREPPSPWALPLAALFTALAFVPAVALRRRK